MSATGFGGASLRPELRTAVLAVALSAMAACAPQGPAAPNGQRAPGAAPDITATTVFLGPRDRVADGFGLYSYVVITSDRLPDAQVRAALCSLADLQQVEYEATVRANEARTVHVTVAPMRWSVDPRAPVPDLRRGYNFADAAAVHRRIGVITGHRSGPLDGIFWVATRAGPLRGNDFAVARDDLVVVRLDGLPPDLLLNWLTEVRRRVQRGDDWRKATLQQRLIRIAQALDVVADFADDVLQFVKPAAAASDEELPDVCRA